MLRSKLAQAFQDRIAVRHRVLDAVEEALSFLAQFYGDDFLWLREAPWQLVSRRSVQGQSFLRYIQ